MKGSNELLLSDETVLEALQEYFDKRMGHHSPKLMEVKQVFTQARGSNPSLQRFQVLAEEKTEAERASGNTYTALRLGNGCPPLNPVSDDATKEA